MMGKSVLLATTAIIAVLSLAGPATAANAPRSPSGAPPSQPAPMPPTVSKQEYDDLKARVDKIEADKQAAVDAAAADHTRLSTLEQAFAYAPWTYDNGRPVIATGDGRFSMAVRARFQFDVAHFLQRKEYTCNTAKAGCNGAAGEGQAQFKDLASGAGIRRAYLGVEGRSFKDFWYEFRLNFGGSNSEGADAAVNIARVAYIGVPFWRLNLGVMQPIFTMSDATSSANLTFIERAAINNIATDAFGGSDARRGIELTYDKTDFLMPGDHILLSGAFTGQKTGNNSNNHGNDEGTQILGRAAYRFWSDGTLSNAQVGMSGAKIMSLTGGAGGSARTITFSERPELRIDGNQLITTGLTGSQCALSGSTTCNAMTGGWLWGFEGGANFENFYVGGEWYNFGVDRDLDFYRRSATAPQFAALRPDGNPEFSGWYVDASWVITGESRVYQTTSDKNEMAAWQAPNVINAFSLNGDSWGAWELAARYSNMDLNWNEGSKGTAVPVGGIRGGEQKVITLGLNWYPNKNVRMVLDWGMVDVDKLNSAGVQIGQKFDTIGWRTQFQF